MNELIEQQPAEFLARLEAAATKTETPCGDGTMVWRLWGDPASPVLVLFHGGAGSWRHWAHNIDVLSRTYRLLVPDLPGLGESAFPPDGDDAMAVATIVASGIDRVLGADARYDVAGFSFGGTPPPPPPPPLSLPSDTHTGPCTQLMRGAGAASLILARHGTYSAQSY